MVLERHPVRELEHWYNSKLRKSPCVLFGLRQVGKSTLAENFAASTNRKVIKINFWKDTSGDFKKIFSKNADAKDIISKLQMVLGQEIAEKSSFLVLDEIQECPAAYSSFKSFKEDTNIPVIATGSYLKLFLRQNQEFEIPVGCTHELLITPMTYGEFLMNANRPLYDYYQSISGDSIIDDFYHQRLLKYYYQYLFTGGMPEAVALFLENYKNNIFQATELTRKIQEQLLIGYKNDFLLLAQNTSSTWKCSTQKLALTFDLIPKELIKYRLLETPVQRFKFSSLGKNEKFSRVSNIFEYLSLSGLIIKSYVMKNIDCPLLIRDSEQSAFKCFYCDVGLLQAALKIPYQKIISDELSSYKGPIAENFVAQHLFALGKEDLYAWKPNNYQEVEFLINTQGGELVPIEVKASRGSSSSASLLQYIKKYKPIFAIKIAPRNYGKNNNMISLPIYLIEKIEKIIEKIVEGFKVI